MPTELDSARPSTARVRRVPLSVVWIGIALWILAPLGLVLITSNENRAARVAAYAPAWTRVERASGTTSESVDVALRWVAGPQLVAPAWSGIVQNALIGAGSSVADGTPIATVDGITRTAWLSSGAFYRVLAPGDVGVDVGWLKEGLKSRGYRVSSGDRFDGVTLAAVRQFARNIGVSGAASTAAFDPSWVLYLPAPIGGVSTVGLVAGAPASPAGTVIASGTPVLAEAAVVAAASGSADSNPSSTQTESDAVYFSRVSTSAIQLVESDQLTYVGAKLQVDHQTSRIEETSLAALARAITPGTPSVPAVVSHAAAKNEFLVPAAAVVSGNQIVVCVRQGTRTRTFPVTVTSSDAGGARVTGPFHAGDKIRIPGPTADFPCASSSSG